MRIRAPRALSAIAWLGIVLSSPAVSADDHVYLTCSSPTYTLGDSVGFVWRNDTDSTLTANSTPPYDITTLDGELVFASPYPMEYDLGPRSQVELFWDQRDFYGNPVPADDYEVRISFVFNHAPPFHGVADTFRILPQSISPDADWGAVKAVFR